MKIYVMGTHYKCLSEALVMSTHNIFFFLCVEIKKLSIRFDGESTIPAAVVTTLLQ